MSTFDWTPIIRDWRAGMLSKGEICRRHGVTMNALRNHTMRHAILYGELRPGCVSAIVKQIDTVDTLTDDEIVSDTAERVGSVVRSHLILTRGLAQRLSGVMELYDRLASQAAAPTVDQEGVVQPVDAGVVASLSSLLDSITKSAERIVKIESGTFGLWKENTGVAETGGINIIGGLPE